MRTLRPVVRPMLLSLALVACGDAGVSEDESEASVAFTEAQLVRPVVLARAPLSLTNPQEDAVTRPLWGGAFAVGTTGGIRASLEATGSAAGGLLLGGRGDPEAEDDRSVAVALVSRAGGWVLRELAGNETLQELPLAAPASLDVSITVARSGRWVKVEAAGQTRILTMRGTLPAESGLYVHLEPGAALAVRDVRMTQPLAPARELGTPLRKLAADRGISIGTATDIWPPLHDKSYESLLSEQFDTAAPTEFYWSTTRGEDKDYFFLPADLTVNYATVHGQKLTGYFLVWDFELPTWVTDIAASGDSAALGKTLDEHIQTLVGRYKGKMNAWVVANEAIWGPDETNGGPAQYADSIWADVLGPEYIERAFRVAHDVDPDAVLLYNETHAEATGPKSDFMYQMAKDLKGRGAPIGGVGFQFHLDASKLPSMADVQANLERFGALGLDVYITELDVSLANVTAGTEAEKQKLQADVYGDVLKACLAVPRCKSYTVFGFSDRYAWDELGDASPLLFDKAYRAKPAFYTVQSLLGR